MPGAHRHPTTVEFTMSYFARSDPINVEQSRKLSPRFVEDYVHEYS